MYVLSFFLLLFLLYVDIMLHVHIFFFFLFFFIRGYIHFFFFSFLSCASCYPGLHVSSNRFTMTSGGLLLVFLRSI